jgi:hypothetical protein
MLTLVDSYSGNSSITNVNSDVMEGDMNKKLTNSLVINFFRALMITLLLSPGISQGQETELTDYDISLELICKSGTSSRNLDGEGTRLTSQKVILREGDTPEQLLERNGIKADGESFGLLYRLNHGFDTKSIKPGSGIILPAIKDREKLSADFEKGCLVALWLDKEQRLAFLRVVNELEPYSKMLSELKVEQFGTIEIKEKFGRALKSIVDNMRVFLEFLRYRPRPVDSQTLRQILREGEQLETILMKITKNHQKVTASDVEIVNRIENNMSIRMKALTEQKGDEGAKRTPFKTIEGVSWNAWFEDTSKVDVKDALVVGERYIVNIDLSRYAYGERYAAIPDTRLSSELKKKEQVRLILQPILIGKLIKAPPDEPFKPQMLTLDRSRLRTDPQDEAKMKEFEGGKLSTRKFSEATNLGSIVSWHVKANSPGCATLAISVWDEASTSPLDHLVVTFPIVKKGQTRPEDCACGVMQKGLQAGLDTLLLTGTSGSSKEAELADAALHIFESFSAGSKHSTAVFVDRDELIKSRSGPTLKGIFAWELTSVLSDYTSGQLAEKIDGAHLKITRNIHTPYKEIPEHFVANIFATDGDNTQSKAAREALQRIVSQKQNAVILSYFIAADGSVLYLPLGLLAATTSNPVLTRRFTLMQILPDQRASADACFDRWTMAIPKKLEGVVTGDGPDALENAARATSLDWMKWVTNNKELDEYMSTGAVLPAREGGYKGGEGLILLAHHGRGDFTFSKSEDPSFVSALTIAREFPRGSVAVLAACSTSGAGQEHRILVNKLNRLGIEAMVLSPFQVEPEFGIHFALAFQKIVFEERGKPNGLTFLEIFQKAIKQTIEALPKDSGYQDMALEFQVVGRTSLRFCEQEQHQKGK